MKTRNSKLKSIVLALCMTLCASVPAFAADIVTSGGTGTTPVSLTSTDDGSAGGKPSGTAMRVTVPTALPMAMSQDGVVTTADNCKIINNSYGAVRVKNVTITAANGWRLTNFGDKSLLAGTGSCTHSSTSKKWSGCNWTKVCDSCGETLDTRGNARFNENKLERMLLGGLLFRLRRGIQQRNKSCKYREE